MTQRSRVQVPPGPLSSNNFEQVIYTRSAQANSAFHTSGYVNEYQLVPGNTRCENSDSLPENTEG